MLKYEVEHGVTKTAERYGMSRKTVNKWKRRYNGTVESLKNRSRATCC
ncbi:MAG: helix-turn-helix domain-containing protein [Candidatus Limiplasma sp.]|nr:helix-turn-helix domain-containing protein [Candidatus Limiplasma sp.]